MSPVRPVLLLLLAFLSRPADAAIVEALSADALLDRSRVVCLFEVTMTRARWAGDRVLTDVVGRCERPVFGAAAGETVEWYVEGGVMEDADVGMRVPGEPSFRRGDRAIVFLSDAAFGLRVTGMSQGAVFVRGETALPLGGGATFAVRTGRGLRSTAGWHASPRPVGEVLGDLERRLRAR